MPRRQGLRKKKRSNMANFNKVILIGNLTKDPEIRYTPNGTAVASFSIAINRRYKQGEELKDEVCYIDIVVFGKQAESCGKYLSKGNGIIVDGRLQQRRWETEDGQKRSKHEVVAQSIRFLSKRDDSSKEGMPDDTAITSQSETSDNDVPF